MVVLVVVMMTMTIAHRMVPFLGAKALHIRFLY